MGTCIGEHITNDGDDYLCIEFDNHINGHDGVNAESKGKGGHCWNLPLAYLRDIDVPEVVICEAAEVIRLK